MVAEMELNESTAACVLGAKMVLLGALSAHSKRSDFPDE